MSSAADLRLRQDRTGPVTNPIRVLLVDPDVASGNAIGRAVDMDRELAMVGFCSDPRRAGIEADHCRPDLIAIRLGLDDERCVSVLAALAAGDAKACVVVLGSPASADPVRLASAVKDRIRAVAESNFGIAPVAPGAPGSSGRRLH